MISTLQTPNDDWAPPTITLDDELPHTIPLQEAPLAVEINWDERIHALCDREPTLDLGIKQRMAAIEAVRTAIAQPTAPTAPAHPPNTLNGRYLLEQPIAAGGSAVIYRARDLQSSDHAARLAVKVLKPDYRNEATAIDRLKREYAYTLKLPHPHIVRVYDLDYCARHGWFMTMELLDGESLASLMRRHDPSMRYERKLAIVTACGEALSFAHHHGVLHCDFKPSNVMLTSSGEIRLLDFGATRMTRDEQGAVVYHAAAATPAYASAQVLSGQPADARDDVFSLACMVYELLGGHHPFGHGNTGDDRKHENTPTRPVSLTHRQWRALQRGLSSRREQRQADAMRLVKDLQAPALATWWLGSAAAVLLIGSAWWATARLPRPQAAAKAPQVAAAVDSTRATQTFNGRVTLMPAVNEALRLPLHASSVLQPSQTHQVSAAPVERRVTTPAKVATRAATVAFTSSRIIVSDRAVAAALTVERTDSNDTQRIQWRTMDGSAHASTDYEASAGNALFNKHQTRRTLYINLKKNAAARGDRSFAVEVRQPGDKQAARTEVIIRRSDEN